MYASTYAELCASLLNYYNEAEQATATDIRILSTHKSDIYGLSTVHKFVYKDTEYYTCDDASLGDSVAYLKEVLSSINHLLKGAPVKNPHLQSDGAQYAGGIGNKEYYLWRVN